MPTSFSSCKAVPEVARGEKKRGRRNAHTHAPLHLDLLPSLRNLISICKRSRFALWKSQQRGAASSVGVLGSIFCPWPRGTWGAGASRALKPFTSPSCFSPQPLFPLLQAQPENEQIPCHHPLPPQLLVPIAIWGGKQLSPQPSQGATSSHSTPGSCSCIDPFSPAMLRACLTSHLSCLPFRVTQSSREPVCVPTPAELPR